MSTPRCIRLAIQACRPQPTSKAGLRIHDRTRAITTARIQRARDIVKGFPMPQLSESELEEYEKSEKVLESIPDPPPKSHPLPAARPQPRADSNASSGASSERTSVAKPAQKHDAGPSEVPVRIPRNVAAAYHKPLRIEATLGVRVASLQLRSYSVRSLEFMADFAMRAAYFLGLTAKGPVPLPKRIERWTMPRSNFVHKKSQENFERITLRRVIQIQDGHKDTVQVWLAYLRKHQFYGVGMKADVWEFESLDVASNMDKQFQQVEKDLDAKLANFGWNKQVAGSKSVTEMLRQQGPGDQIAVGMSQVREASRTSHQSI